MRLSQYIDSGPVKRKKSGKRAKLAAHPVFVPMVTVWGAALFGLSVAVLPQVLIERISVLSGTGFLGDAARFAYAGVAALLGAGIAFFASASLREKAQMDEEQVPVITAVHSRRVRPIDPAQDLGSESLDAPIEDVPFKDVESDAEASPKRQPTLGELAQRGYEFEAPEDCSASSEADALFTRKDFRAALIETCEGASCEAAHGADEAEPVRAEEKTPQAAAPAPSLSDRPREMDLAEFGELANRNAVWVEEPAPAETQAAAPVVAPVEAPAREQAPASALEKLRARNPEELSLVEMVERFAGALHEHQQSERVRQADNSPVRDAALAEALKALTMFTSAGFDRDTAAQQMSQIGETERELRDALGKLQSLRGAA